MKINNINYEAIKRTRKARIRIPKWLPYAAVAIISITTVAGILSIDVSARNNNAGIVQQEKLGNNVLTQVYIKVNSGDTLSDIANRYYTDETASAYESVDNFEAAIAKANQIQNKNILYPNQNLQIPVVVAPDNLYYLEVVAAQRQISNFPKESLWVDHKVEIGDNLYSLASLSCIDGDDIIATVEQIKKQNNITSPNIMLGSVIKIKNPALAELKQNLSDAEEAFIESLTQGQMNY